MKTQKDIILKKVYSLISEEAGICERIINGGDYWTITDCQYIIEAKNLLDKIVEQ